MLVIMMNIKEGTKITDNTLFTYGLTEQEKEDIYAELDRADEQDSIRREQEEIEQEIKKEGESMSNLRQTGKMLLENGITVISFNERLNDIVVARKDLVKASELATGTGVTIKSRY